MPGEGRATDIATLIIADGASISSILDMRGHAGFEVDIPTGLAGHMHFKTSTDGANFKYVYDEFGALISMSPSAIAGAGRMVSPVKLFNTHYLVIQMDTTATGTSPQVQTGAKTLVVALKS